MNQDWQQRFVLALLSGDEEGIEKGFRDAKRHALVDEQTRKDAIIFLRKLGFRIGGADDEKSM